MRIYTIQREQPIPLAPAEAFEFFSDPFNLEAITRRWLHLNVVTDGPIAMRPGTLIEYLERIFSFRRNTAAALLGEA